MLLCFCSVDYIEDGPIVYTAANYILWFLSLLLIGGIGLSLLFLSCLLSNRAAPKREDAPVEFTRLHVNGRSANGLRLDISRMTSPRKNDVTFTNANGVAIKTGKTKKAKRLVTYVKPSPRRCTTVTE